MIGTLLGNRYEILEQLGGGGMAIIYKARDNILNRLVSVKILRPEYTCDGDFVKRFRREAQAVASLSHPNIVSIYDVGQEDEVYYLVMEYIEGDNLKNLIREKGALPPEQAVEIARQVSEALQHAHGNNIVHRDVKPQNILITKDGRAKLTDFGIAREATTATLTQTDTIVGSVHYLSPEQARGETAGPRSDIYSLGVVLYEMVTGALPFQGDTPIGVALKHIQESPPSPSSINPAVSPVLEKIINRAMAKFPVDRFAMAKDLATDLERLPGAVSLEPNRAATVDEFATRVITTMKPAQETIQPVQLVGSGKKRRLTWLWAALLLLGLVAAGITAFQLYVNVPEVSMPDVQGMTLEEARSALQKQGIKNNNIHVERKNHHDVPVGDIISQDPPPETKIKVTRNVTLTVSLGAESRDVPEVIGRLFNEAKIMLNQADLNVIEPPRELYSDEYPQGVVVDQEPKPNIKLAKGSGVTLYVSKGKEPVTQKTPDLAGLTLDQARTALEKVKLKLDSNVGRASSNEYFSGLVAAQSPVKGTEVQEGSTVQVILSSGPGPKERVARVEIEIPASDKKELELKITVTDMKGTRNFYVNTHRPGEIVVKDVPYYGKAVIRGYIDNKPVGEYDLE